MLGEEALTKGCRILLAPTLNLHRSPLAGRNFECFSEDPLLAGRAAAAYVRGVQSRGRRHDAQAPGRQRGRARPLHDVLGDRRARAARALPRPVRARRPRGRRARADDRLQPVQRRLLHRGRGAAERHPARRVGLRGLRRLATGSALGSTTGSPRAGLDLEMPGPGRIYGPALADAVRAGEVDEALVDAQVRRLLGVLDRIGALDDDPDAPERSEDRPGAPRARPRGRRRELRAAAQRGRRCRSTRPRSARWPCIGPNADRAQIMGGGSAKLRAHYPVTPLEALREALADGVELRHERGCDIDRTAPELRAAVAGRVRGLPTTSAERDSRAAVCSTPVAGDEIGLPLHRASAAQPSRDRAATRSRCARAAARGCWSTARSCSTGSPTRRRAARR